MALSDNSLTYIHKDGHNMLRALLLLPTPQLHRARHSCTGVDGTRWLPLVLTDLHVLNCVLEKCCLQPPGERKKPKKNHLIRESVPAGKACEERVAVSANDVLCASQVTWRVKAPPPDPPVPSNAQRSDDDWWMMGRSPLWISLSLRCSVDRL